MKLTMVDLNQISEAIFILFHLLNSWNWLKIVPMVGCSISGSEPHFLLPQRWLILMATLRT
jgi:hypothetical protein